MKIFCHDKGVFWQCIISPSDPPDGEMIQFRQNDSGRAGAFSRRKEKAAGPTAYLCTPRARIALCQIVTWQGLGEDRFLNEKAKFTKMRSGLVKIFSSDKARGPTVYFVYTKR